MGDTLGKRSETLLTIRAVFLKVIVMLLELYFIKLCALIIIYNRPCILK